MLKGIGLRKSYRGREVVRGVDIEVGRGEIVGLLGPNGAGKTTTFYMMVGLVRPDEGRVLLDGRDVGRLGVVERARAGIVYLPQEASVFRRLTVEENVVLVLEERGKDREEARRRAEELLEVFGLKGLRNQKAATLSGGERRRVEIMRALAAEPSYLLLDEPFAGIDPIAVSQLKELFALLKGRGLGLLVSDHNVRETLSVCDRAYIVSEGRIIAKGVPEEVVRDERVKASYLGEEFSL